MKHKEGCQCYVCRCSPRIGRTWFFTENSEYRLQSIWFDGYGWNAIYRRSSKKLSKRGCPVHIASGETTLDSWNYWIEENGDRTEEGKDDENRSTTSI